MHARSPAGRPAGRSPGDSGDIRWCDAAATEISRRMRMRTRSIGRRAPAQNQSRYATPGVTFANLSRIFEFRHLCDVCRGQEHARRSQRGSTHRRVEKIFKRTGHPLVPRSYIADRIARARSQGDEEVCRLEFAREK